MVDCPGVTEDRKLQAHGLFLPGQDSQGACSSCDSCLGTLSLTLGPAPPGLPAGHYPCGLESRWPVGWMRPGCRPRGDAERRGVAPQHCFVQCPGGQAVPSLLLESSPPPPSARLTQSVLSSLCARLEVARDRQVPSACLVAGFLPPTHGLVFSTDLLFPKGRRGRRREGRGSWLEECFLPRSHRRSHRLGAEATPHSVCPGAASCGKGGRYRHTLAVTRRGGSRVLTPGRCF